MKLGKFTLALIASSINFGLFPFHNLLKASTAFTASQAQDSLLLEPQAKFEPHFPACRVVHLSVIGATPSSVALLAIHSKGLV
ncbi:hypothetical protein ACFLU9_00325 [Chloroflexota bacterium]